MNLVVKRRNPFALRVLRTDWLVCALSLFPCFLLPGVCSSQDTTEGAACVISDGTSYVRVGQVITFKASLHGVPDPNASWSVSPNGGSINSQGVYTAPASVPGSGFTTISAICGPTVKVATKQVPVWPSLPALQTASPASVSPSATSIITVTGTNVNSISSLMVNGVNTPFTVLSQTQLAFQSAVSSWQTPTSLAITAIVIGTGGGTSNQVSVTIGAPNVSFDAAVRFLGQAGFGATQSSVAQVQQMGMSAWIDAQLSSPLYDYTTVAGAHAGQWYRNSQNPSTVLRQRVSLALSHIYVTGNNAWCFWQACSPVWEGVLQKDAFGNARQLLNDISLHQIMGHFLNNADNYGGSGRVPNQNFAREIMQLMTIGPNQLRADGSTIMDSNNEPVPTYTQDNIVAMSNALSGWVTPTGWIATPAGTVGNPLLPKEELHTQGAKKILPGTTLPTGQGIVSDLDKTLDALFNSPNYGPFLGLRLIQALVTSNPSPAYIARVSAVFANDGTGVRGNLGAVVKAILLDPEARANDIPSSMNPSGGHLMEPVLYLASVMNTVGGTFTDDQVSVADLAMGEQHWNEPNVFSYFDPNHTLADGTPAPEEELMITSNVTSGLEIMYGAMHSKQGGFSINWSASPFWNCSSVADLIDRINHYLYHGILTAQEQSVLSTFAYSESSSSVNDSIADTVFLAVSSTSYKVIR